MTTLAAMEGLGYGGNDNGLLFALNASLWTITMPILEFGTEAQKRHWLPKLCDGTLFAANGASEPEAGSDIFRMQTRAQRKGDGWVLNGRKVWITGAPVADLFLCFATTDPARGVMGITTFLIPNDTKGLRVVRTIDKMGTRTAPFGEIVFEDCALPAESLLGREGRGSRIFNAALEWERGADPRLRPGRDAQADRTLRGARPQTHPVWPADRQVPGGLAPHRRDVATARNQSADGLPLRLVEGHEQRRPRRRGGPWPSCMSPNASSRTAWIPLASSARRVTPSRIRSNATCATASVA